MSLFHKKINPFSSLTINLGPLYIERVFDSLLTLQGVKEVVRMQATERFERYLDYLREKTDIEDHDQYTIIQFYKAHFYQQLAHHSPSCEHRVHWQEKALCYYQDYLELSTRLDESRFYAQWQSGMLQAMLNYPWSLVEESLLMARPFDPRRAEPLKNLVDHYMRAKQFNVAYTYSTLAVNEHFEKDPAATRRWFVEHDAYNWNVVNKHCTICYKLGYTGEAEKAYNKMLEYEIQHLDEFKASEIRHIHFLERIFHQPKPVPATAS
jgi:tetratricopeptide (TPR) repeat protein